MQLAFSHLNLRRNPFGEVPADERGKLAVVDVERFAARLAEPGFAVQFVGECGRGKSTHLRALREHFPQAPFVRVAERPRGFRMPKAPVVFVDEAQFLSRRQRRRAFRDDASYAVGSHEDLGRVFERAGLGWETVAVGGADTARVARIVERRIEWARRGPGPVPRLAEAAVEALVARHGDDVRAIEDHLYEVFQQLEEVGDVQVRHLG